MWTTMESPIGPLRIVERGDAISAIEFSPFRDGDGRPRGDRDDRHPVLVRMAAQLEEYFAGQRTAFDVPLDPAGTAWQRAVWEQLRAIAYGDTATYGQIAVRLGRSNAASRAVGLANGANPIPIVVPCHRVVGADGTLTGYAGGHDRKQQLLDLEQGSLF